VIGTHYRHRSRGLESYLGEQASQVGGEPEFGFVGVAYLVVP
jgi:hypothetical protein